jgi:hypothetical protein
MFQNCLEFPLWEVDCLRKPAKTNKIKTTRRELEKQQGKERLAKELAQGGRVLEAVVVVIHYKELILVLSTVETRYPLFV